MNLLKIGLDKKKFSIFEKKNIYSIILILLIFLIDRYSKMKILDNLNQETIYVNSFINFDLIWNTGIGFGLFDHNTALIYNSLTLIIGFVLLALIYIAIFSEKIDTFIFSIIIGGALGNFYDRLRLNAVPDFIDIHYMNFHWFTFNVADIFITLGIITFLLKDFFIKKNEK